MRLKNLEKDFLNLANPPKAKILARFFKTGKGEYGEGDKFLGLTVPQQRSLVKKYKDLALSDCLKLLASEFHEHRLTALLIMVYQYEKTEKKEEIYSLYLQNTKYINNWDLVDLTAPKIVGNFLLNKDRSILYRLARSKNIWKRRIAVLATFAFIRAGEFEDIVNIATMLLQDGHDLIHKAVGWMLREMGKKKAVELEKFLDKYTPIMPRTMLRYSIEKLPEKKRKYYLTLGR